MLRSSLYSFTDARQQLAVLVHSSKQSNLLSDDQVCFSHKLIRFKQIYAIKTYASRSTTPCRVVKLFPAGETSDSCSQANSAAKHRAVLHIAAYPTSHWNKFTCAFISLPGRTKAECIAPKSYWQWSWSSDMCQHGIATADA